MRPAAQRPISIPIALTRTDLLTAAGLGLSLVILASLALFTPTAAGSFHDDAIYISTAKALAEGDGYAQINLPGSPPQTKYPILYPLVLAGVWQLWPEFPANLWALQGLTIAAAAGAIGLGYLYLIRFRYASRSLAFGATALAVTTPFLLYVSTRVLSEMPFALLLVIALWRLEHVLRNDTSTASDVLSGAILALPFLCRSIGLAFGIAALGLLLIRRERWVWCMSGFVAAACPWVLWSATAMGEWQRNSIVGYYTDYVGSLDVVAADPARFILWNLVYLSLDISSPALTGTQYGAFHILGWTLAPVLIMVGAVGWLGVLRRALRLEVLPTILISYLLLVIVWPWPPARFLMPVLPFLLALFGYTLASVAARLLPSLHRFALWSALTIAIGANLFYLTRLGPVIDRMGYPTVALPIREVSWKSYEQLFEWIKVHTAATDRIAAGMDSMVYLYTGRQGFRPYRHRPERLFYHVPGPKGGDPQEVMAALEAGGARYLAVFPLPGFAVEDPFAEAVAGIRRTMPERLTPVFIGRDPRFVVFAIR